MPKSLILEPFWMTFGITFSINFYDRLNLVICNKNNAKTFFLPFQASLSVGMPIMRYLFKPCFHETIVILVPLRHRGFWKVILFDIHWLMFCFRCVSLYFVLYNILNTFVQKTSVNAQPLSCPFFEEIAAQKKNISNLCACVCVFSIFSYFCWFSGTPTPWARLALVWIDFGAIWGLTFPALSAARAELMQRLRKKLRKKLAENLQRTSKQLTRNAKNLQRTSKKLMQRTFPKATSQAAYSIHRRDSNRNKPQATKKGAAVLALAHSDIYIFKYVHIYRKWNWIS